MTTVETVFVHVDTSKSLDTINFNKGDNYTMGLDKKITCCEGQKIKATLQEFSMHKTWADVNTTNNTFRLSYQHVLAGGGPHNNIAVSIPQQNYKTIRDLGQAFSDAIGRTVTTASAAITGWQTTVETASATVSDLPHLTPRAGTTISGTTDNIITFRVEFVNGTGTSVDGFTAGVGSCTGGTALNTLNFTNLNIQFREEDGDCAQLLGGDRILSSQATGSAGPSSITVAAARNTNGAAGPNDAIEVTCRYPAVRYTIPNVYIRTDFLSSSFSSLSIKGIIPTAENDQSYSSSDILGIVGVDTEFCKYSGDIWKHVVYKNEIDKITLRLTDKYNRNLARLTPSSTATGGGTAQNSLGNLNFTASLRFDIIQDRDTLDVNKGCKIYR
jgi:hypothetical protein